MDAIEDLRITGTHRLLPNEVRIVVSQELMIPRKKTCLFMLGIAFLLYITNIY